MNTEKAYFDGIKPGDTIYHWEMPVIVSILYAFIDSIFTQLSNGNNKFLCDYNGCYSEHSSQEYFWAPVQKPVAPPKPIIVKKGQVWKRKDSWLDNSLTYTVTALNEKRENERFSGYTGRKMYILAGSNGNVWMTKAFSTNAQPIDAFDGDIDKFELVKDVP